MNVGNLKIKGKLLLAPMSDITNLPFRILCRKYGASLVYTEMINCDAYIMENNKTNKRAKFLDIERPIAVQIFGSSVEKLTKASKLIEKQLKPDIIDINIGCPAYDVMKIGGGASLLNTPKKLQEIVKNISENISIPLTCKIRVLQDEKDTIHIAKLIERNGAKLITVHGRTAKQGYSGKSNWKIIKKIKRKLHIPVVLNGDVIDGTSAKKALVETGCDALMIGRAAIKNPKIFSSINNYLENGIEDSKLSFQEKMDLLIEYINLSKKYEYTNYNVIRNIAFNFVKGYKNSSNLRKEISKTKNYNELIKICRENSKLF